MPESSGSKTSPLSALPSVDQLLRTEVAVTLRPSMGIARITELAREVTDEMRARLKVKTAPGKAKTEPYSREALLVEAVQRLKDACKRERLAGLRRVINATGVILHTNLGRAPLSEAVRTAVLREAAGYCTLEYDSTTGTRGRRAARVEKLLLELTGAEDALVVNNCASAALLILTVLARDGETIVSRGELVEIGGDFRVPDVMANSGTRMIEVGTTNRTRLNDYRRAVNEKTRLIMRVHPSNYRIVGFTAAPLLSELASLAHETGLFLYEDAGSGALTDLSQYGLADEPTISDCISQGANVVSFSGDKLLGSVQAGLIVGNREIIQRLRKHSLYRALRVDKLTLAALEATLEAHRRGTAVEEIPTLRMLSLSQQEIEKRARSFLELIPDPGTARATVIDGQSAVGGGSGPNAHPPTALIALEHDTLSASDIERLLRLSSPPVISRIADGKVLLDLRTVSPEEEPDLLAAIQSLVV